MQDTLLLTQGSAFEAGLAAGLDPDSQLPRADDDTAGSRRSVTLRSRWRSCPGCGHSFRVGDDVLVAIDGQARHDMPGLRCSGHPDVAPVAVSNAAEFFAGLDQAWPAPEGVRVTRLDAGHPLLAPPSRRCARAACRICAQTFRLGDQVIVCPCSPDQPKCHAAVHRDTLKQLHCWEEWESARSVDVCLGMT